MITLPITVALTVDTSQTSYMLGVSSNQVTVPLGTDMVFELVDAPRYQGPYEVTPSGQTQTLNTENLLMTDNLVIKPIPSNYGLIGWNGSVLTVS